MVTILLLEPSDGAGRIRACNSSGEVVSLVRGSCTLDFTCLEAKKNQPSTLMRFGPALVACSPRLRAAHA